MKRLLTLAILCGTTATATAHQPMPAPAIGPVEYTAGYTPEPVPTPNGAVPPAPGLQPGTIVGSVAVAPGQQVLAPIPAHVNPGTVICNSCDGGHIQLYKKVRVVHARNIAPCAVSKIVSVPDPCDPCKCVFIEICVPPGRCENIEVNPRKNRVVFDYGRYSVQVTERRGTLWVNYQD
jgi:hypothetical protein